MSLYGSRRERFVYELLDRRDRIVGVLDGISSGGRLTFATAATVRGTGTLPAAGEAAQIDWSTHRLRVSYQADDMPVVPLITAIVQAPEDQHSASEVTTSLTIGDKLLIPNGDAVTSFYALAKGEPIIPAVRDLLLSSGVLSSEIMITDSSKVMSSNKIWEPGVTKLEIINALLDMAGYWSLWCDGLGRFCSSPYVEPALRPVAWQFEDDADTGLYKTSWKLGRKTLRPNRYICTVTSDPGLGNDLPSIAPAVVYDLASYYEIGYWITVTDTNVDAADSDALMAICRRRFAEARAANETVTFTHPWVPGFADGPDGLNKIATFTHSRLGRVIRGGVQRQDWTLAPGGLIETSLRGYV